MYGCSPPGCITLGYSIGCKDSAVRFLAGRLHRSVSYGVITSLLAVIICLVRLRKMMGIGKRRACMAKDCLTLIAMYRC